METIYQTKESIERCIKQHNKYDELIESMIEKCKDKSTLQRFFEVYIKFLKEKQRDFQEEADKITLTLINAKTEEEMNFYTFIIDFFHTFVYINISMTNYILNQRNSIIKESMLNRYKNSKEQLEELLIPIKKVNSKMLEFFSEIFKMENPNTENIKKLREILYQLEDIALENNFNIYDYFGMQEQEISSSFGNAFLSDIGVKR